MPTNCNGLMASTQHDFVSVNAQLNK